MANSFKQGFLRDDTTGALVVSDLGNFGVKANIKADGRTVNDAAITSGQATLSSASAAFAQKDVGKLCVVVGAGSPVSTTISVATGVGAVTALSVAALSANFPSGGVLLNDGAGHTQTFYTSGALSGATSIPLIGPIVGGLTSALSTGGPITSLPVAPLNFALASGTVVVISYDSAGVLHAQTFTTTGAALGATSIPVTSATPNYAFPESATLFGSPISQTPNFNYPIGTSVKSDTPALHTTILSVAGGVATLAANAGTTVSGAECFFASDDTAAVNTARTAAEAVGGTVVLPEGQIGISAAIASSNPITFRGQSVSELYGGTGAANDANWPTVSPYLRGSVLVQCARDTDILQLSAQGRAQNVQNLGLRFAGKFARTGYGIRSTPPTTGLGQIGSIWEDVRVYGVDGNHYGFVLDSPELFRCVGLRSYGGGGLWFKTNSGIPGPPGNTSFYDFASSTFIAGWAQGVLLDCSGAPSLLAMDSNLFSDMEIGVRIPNPAIGFAPPRAGAVQNPLQALNPTQQTLTAFVLPGAEHDPGGAQITWPNGVGCWRTNDFNAPFAKGSQDTPGNPASGVGLQNLVGKPLVSLQQFNFRPAASVTPVGANTTLNGAQGSGTVSLLVASSANFVAGQGIQIGPDANGDIEYAIVASVPDGTHITILTPGNWGTIYSHAAAAPVQAGAAVLVGQVSSTNAWPGTRWIFDGAPIGAQHNQRSYSMPLPASFWQRFDWANVDRMWSDYGGSFG